MTDTKQKTHTMRVGEHRSPHPVRAASPLASAHIENEAGETYRLRLVASGTQEAGSLASLAESIRHKGYRHSFADLWQDRHVLVIGALTAKEADRLVHALEAEGYLNTDETRRPAMPEGDSWSETLRRDSLKWSGRFAMAASAAVAAAGIGQKDMNRVYTGLGFMMADAIVAKYGNGKGSIDFDALFRDMHRHFETNGVHLPHIASPQERRNAAQQVEHFIATHPVELNYGLGMLGGIGHIRSGLADFSRSGAGISRLTKGVLGTGGSAAVVFLDEDKSREKRLKKVGHYLSHPLEIPQGLTDFVLASPIRFKGIISSVYSMLYLTDALEEKKKMKLWAEQKGGLFEGKNMATLRSELGQLVAGDGMKAAGTIAIEHAGDLRRGILELERREGIAKTFFGGKVTPYLSAFTGLCYVAASLLASVSSKNRDESYQSADEYERMYAMAAQTILGVPKADREAALTQIATYLSTRKDVRDGEVNAPRIIEEVSRRIGRLEQSPWLSAHQENKAMMR